MSLYYIREFLSYDPETGLFTWIKASKHGGVRPGDMAGRVVSPDGYRRIGFRGRKYKASRLAWFFAHGEMPPQLIDHINLNRADDRIANLRPATPSQNVQNHKAWGRSQYRGVCLSASRKWQAQIWTGSRKLYLGSFDNEADAALAYNAAALEHFGEFARLNVPQ